ncbi:MULTISPECIES: DUF349 domain-containing protein [unclassified Pseudoalteromonas]|uniref:DUF349 domain-containing protein n=1 Tax=unclassified Pseudoalteromonas TaxID=194690 RepID=UPI001108F192|nr:MULTISPECIES: DUF349 domain-containing protein [unclassified Pseudoalteromonas]TMN78604.1 DUF349 domain-containing protein [Pseudoalteromonas sp. S410]TMN88213.1 DUF349 domain-containing protein [Pseudoalteromonas sp. S408]TMN96615.1 DUF349 domain-containing protein [Pseudoalteromonas sp. S407]TMO01499.1 DUF349 domain-containing protein [Pseudoalteromonas sp. S409]TMO10932.1 DUF349 domain-containing protein [Pseudoalteromonas sp. S186]
MIFKHLFTPKWKHPKQQVRLDAIEKLDTQRDASILNTLALEDSSAEIRRKALQKVNDLPLWWKAYKQDQALKDIAEQQISNAVLNSESTLTPQIKSEYIERFAPVKTLEKLAFAEKELKVRVKLLKRLANAKLVEKAFKEGSEELQAQLIELVINHQLTKPLAKHAKGEAKATLDTHIENERLAKEMPQEVENSTRVILAKLNALREKTDFAIVNPGATELMAQWQALELKWLTTERIKALDEKYIAITSKLDTHIAQLKTEHDKEQQLLALKQRQLLALATLEALSDEIENALQVGLETPEQIQQDWLDAKVAQAKQAITETELENNAQSKAVIVKLESLFSQVAKLPELTTAIAQYKEALTALKLIEPAQTLEQYDETLSAFNQAFKETRGHLSILDSTLQGKFKAELNTHKKQFLALMNDLIKPLEKNQSQAKRKARDVKRLIEEGRFNVAFGVFKGFEELFNTLTARYQQPLENIKAELEQQLADAKDWQKYAAAPKRVALLEEVTQLTEQECTDPQQRAEQVKMLRTRWNELGRLDTDEEKQQGVQFDEHIEILFAPCRSYFAEQEEKRDAAKLQRESIITDMHTLGLEPTSEDGFDWKQFESQYNKLNKAWRSVGKVDPKTYRVLNDRYKSEQQQVLGLLNAFHKGNAALKNDLVEQAQKLSQSDDLASACQALKQMQQQWQTIGFAGLKAENAMWQKFRQYNDEAFSKRSTEFEQQKLEQNESDKQAAAELAELEAALEAVEQRAQLHDLETKVKGYAQFRTLAPKVAALLKAIDEKVSVLMTKLEQANLEALLSALQNNEEIPAQYQATLKTSLNEEQLITRMEILANVSSPNASLRMAEQVAMLDDKHRGDHADLNYYLKQLLALSNGSVEPETLARLKSTLAA